MTALHSDPIALAGILRERQGDYEFAARGSVQYYQRLLDFGAWLTALKNACAHGVWMKALKAAGWSYSICNRAMKLHSLPVSAAELALEGAKAVLKRFARPRRPAQAEEVKFSASTEFDPPPETPPGAGDNPLLQGDEGATAGASAEPTPEPGSGPKEPAVGPAPGPFVEGDTDSIPMAWQRVREGLRSELGEGVFKSWINDCRIEVHDREAVLFAPTRFIRDRVQQNYGDRIRELWHRELSGVQLDREIALAPDEPHRKQNPDAGEASPDAKPVWPWPLDMKYSGDRVMAVALAPGPRLPQARLPAMILAYWNIFKDGKQQPAELDNKRLAAMIGTNERTLKEWLAACRETGLLHSVPQRGNRPDRQYVWPHVPKGMEQRSMPLARVFDRTYRPSEMEAAESAAAMPRGAAGRTPEVRQAAQGDETGRDVEVNPAAPLNGEETEKETAAPTPPAHAKRGRRAAG